MVDAILNMKKLFEVQKNKRNTEENKSVDKISQKLRNVEDELRISK
jgi:hypothetical protein